MYAARGNLRGLPCRGVARGPWGGQKRWGEVAGIRLGSCIHFVNTNASRAGDGGMNVRG